MSASTETSRDTTLNATTVKEWVREQGVAIETAYAQRLAKNLRRLAPQTGLDASVKLHTSTPRRSASISDSGPQCAPDAEGVQLPATLVGLRRQIAHGAITSGTAVLRQLAQLEYDACWHALTHRFPVDENPAIDGPLACVGLAHKDIFTMRGRAPRCGTTYVPDPTLPSSPVVTALEAAGSLTLAAAAMPEFASGVTGENPDYPQPVNPIDPLAAVGGSSSGSAVAVASGLCYGSLGTDTAGSVRIPAATCGVVGLMPTRGLLSRQGCFPLAPGLDTVGILARSALDVAQLLYHSLPKSLAQQRLPSLSHLDQETLLAAGERVYDGLPLDTKPRLTWVVDHSDPRFCAAPELAAAIESFAADFDAAGRASHQRLHLQPELTRAANLMMHVEAAATHAKALRGEGPALGKVAAAVAMPGLALPASWYAQSLQARDRLRQEFCAAHLNDADLLLTPILPCGVPDWGLVHTDSPAFQPAALLGLFSWTAFVNYLGLPAIVFPIGRDTRGRPLSVQVIGRPDSEELLLAFAWHHERMHYGLDGVLPDVFST